MKDDRRYNVRMTELDGDEALVLIFACIASLIFLGRWYAALFSVSQLVKNRSSRLILALAPLVAGAGILATIELGADPAVLANNAYVVLFGALGVAWCGTAVRLLPLVGLSARDDVLETSNLGAAVAVAGVFLGVGACYAGANIGVGPTIWTTIIPAFEVTLAFFAMLALLEATTHISVRIASDRELSAGVRLAVFAVIIGLILGRSAAGDYESDAATVRDIALSGWPALAVTALAIGVERARR